MTTETKQLQPYEGEFAILGPEADEYLDILEENTGSRKIEAGSLPVWKFPGSGNDEWVFEDEAGTRHKEKSLIGVVLGQRVERTFYMSDYGGGGDKPDCRSNDGVNGHTLTDETGQPINLMFAPNGTEIVYGGACETCPLNQWESAALVGKKGNGKACTEYRFGIIQRPDQPTPEGFRLPPTALKAWTAFGEQVSRARTRLSTLVIELRLQLPKGASTAELYVDAVSYIPKDTSEQLKAIAPAIRRQAQLAPVNAAQVSDEPPPIEGEAQPF